MKFFALRAFALRGRRSYADGDLKGQFCLRSRKRVVVSVQKIFSRRRPFGRPLTTVPLRSTIFDGVLPVPAVVSPGGGGVTE